jgi:hypothetical protein
MLEVGEVHRVLEVLRCAGSKHLPLTTGSAAGSGPGGQGSPLRPVRRGLWRNATGGRYKHVSCALVRRRSGRRERLAI